MGNTTRLKGSTQMGKDDSSIVANRRLLQSLRRARALARSGHACAICGERAVPEALRVASIEPIAHGGALDDENFVVLCANCNANLQREPRESEFTHFLAGLIEHTKGFAGVRLDARLGNEIRFVADVIADRSSDGFTEELLIECKMPQALGPGRISSVLSQLRTYRELRPDAKVVLAAPVTLSAADQSAFQSAGIEAWDLPYIANHFSHAIESSSPSYYSTLFKAKLAEIGTKSEEQRLLDKLAACQPGKKDWLVYQQLVGQILEHLFSPPLSKPLAESSDATGANRRDFVIPNYVEAGFWAFMREKYDADYVVVDAKNFVSKVKKTEVLQLANYLKPHGAGLFGIIVSRNGGDTGGCQQTLREQWIMHRKLILVLDDEDVRQMLVAKSDGRPAEDYLGQKIQAFRLQM